MEKKHLLIAGGLAVAAIGGYFLYKKFATPAATSTGNSSVPVNTSTSSTSASSGSSGGGLLSTLIDSGKSLINKIKDSSNSTTEKVVYEVPFIDKAGFKSIMQKKEPDVAVGDLGAARRRKMKAVRVKKTVKNTSQVSKMLTPEQRAAYTAQRNAIIEAKRNEVLAARKIYAQQKALKAKKAKKPKYRIVATQSSSMLPQVAQANMLPQVAQAVDVNAVAGFY
ncbi:MAG: hypothetical protein LBS50_10945 [Prevotellaceae bacterium]|jgi:hypothetical protein|nr:hypothetical protein [Prevotellaceae bacterium]